MNAKRRIIFVFVASLLAAAAGIAAAQEQSEAAGAAAPAKAPVVSPFLDIYADATYTAGEYGSEITDRGFSPKLGGALRLDAGFLGLVADLSANMDGKYAPALADIPGGTLFNIYFMLEQGGLYSKLGPVFLKAGRFRHYDTVDTPYSLFVNSSGIAANIMEIRYDDNFFSYESRWIELNHDSTMDTAAWGSYEPTAGVGKGFPERGANIKTYSIHLGEMRFGFQDAAVYTGRNFDPEYFLNPIPQYFIQYVKGTGGRPWATDSDDNNIVGVFWTWERPREFSVLAQFLMDDFNVHWLFPETTWNPWQAALTLGGRLETPAGSFGLYLAGATKYTFEPSEMGASDINKAKLKQTQVSYGYTYYPETRFDYSWTQAGFQARAIAIEDNMLGYKYGQNNLAVQVDWRGRQAGFNMEAALEFRLVGANSPANPWHDRVNPLVDGTHWFDDPVLEKRVLAGFSASRDFGPWSLHFGITGGVAFDAMQLRAPVGVFPASTAPVDSNVWIWQPTEGNHRLLLSLRIGGSYHWKLR